MSNAAERIAQSSTSLAARMLLRRASGGPIDPRSIHRILVVRVDDRVGNVLLTTPLMRALREGLPHARLDWLISAKRRPLVEGLFLADSLIPWDKARSVGTLWSSLRKLRKAKYDLVIEASHYDVLSTTSALVTRFTGAPIRIGSRRGDAERYFTHPVEIPEGLRYDVAARLKLLEPLGLADRGWEMETSLGASDEDSARALEALRQVGLDPMRFFVVNPGARKLDRRFEPAALGALVSAMAQKTDLQALVVWGPGEESLAEETVRASEGRAKVAPPNDLPLLAALLRRSKLLVTNDTGPMHLGVACGSPVLALFLQADEARWGHPLETFRALRVDEENLESKAVAAAVTLVGAGEERGR